MLYVELIALVCKCKSFFLTLVHTSWTICVWRSLVFQIVGRSHWWSLYLSMLQSGLQLKSTILILFFLWLVKSLKNLYIIGLDHSTYIISIAKIPSKKIVPLICSVEFLSGEVVLYFYKSTIPPYMEYCCLVWANVLSCYLEL